MSEFEEDSGEILEEVVKNQEICRQELESFELEQKIIDSKLIIFETESKIIIIFSL